MTYAISTQAFTSISLDMIAAEHVPLSSMSPNRRSLAVE
jgi:hypothetical protein